MPHPRPKAEGSLHTPPCACTFLPRQDTGDLLSLSLYSVHLTLILKPLPVSQEAPRGPAAVRVLEPCPVIGKMPKWVHSSVSPIPPYS